MSFVIFYSLLIVGLLRRDFLDIDKTSTILKLLYSVVGMSILWFLTYVFI